MPQAIASVNKTGMWSFAITKKFIEMHVLSRYNTRFLKEPTLLIIDSYSAHLKLKTDEAFQVGLVNRFTR